MGQRSWHTKGCADLIVRAVLFCLTLEPTIALSADFDYAAYKPTTIQEMLKERKDDECRNTEPNESIYSSYAHKYRVVTKFTGEVRQLNPEVKDFLLRWGKAMTWNQAVAETFKHEFLVIDGDQKYWVPVQEVLLPFMGHELEVGKPFELYVAVIGSVNQQCVFTANEFRATP